MLVCIVGVGRKNWADKMVVAGFAMFTWVLLVGWADMCCNGWEAVWDVHDMHLGMWWLVDGVCICAFQGVIGWWLVKGGIDVVWKSFGYVTISAVLFTCWLSVLSGCAWGGVGVVGRSWWMGGRDGFSLDGNLGVNLGLAFGAFVFLLLFLFLFRFDK